MLLESGRTKTVAILESFLRGRAEMFLVLNSIPQCERKWGAGQYAVPHESNPNH
ncbi:MAG: hypothetical protein ACYSTI_13525 [Planctomycetota bacterium]